MLDSGYWSRRVCGLPVPYTNRENGGAMKTFFERFLDEITRKLEAGEIDEEKAQRWIAEIEAHLQQHAQHNPQAPIVKMPLKQ